MKLQQLFENNSNLGVPLPVFRGLAMDSIKRYSGQPVNFPIRKDRVPTDASYIFSAMFNMGIAMSFGVPEIRKQSAFASTDRSAAQRYATRSTEDNSRPGSVAAIVQLHVPAAAIIVFNPTIQDSYELEEDTDDVHELVSELRSLWIENADESTGPREMHDFYQSVPISNKSDYLSLSGQEFLRKIVSVAIPNDPKAAQTFLTRCDVLAGHFADGYEAMSAQEFSTHYANNTQKFEVMIAGADSFMGIVLE